MMLPMNIMNRIKRLATESPLGFGLVLTLAFILMVIMAAVVANQWPAESQGWYIAATAGRVVFITMLMILVSRLGWLDLTGFTRPGRWRLWLLTLPLLAYGLIASALAMTGNLNFSISDPALVGFITLFLLTHACLEEVVFRGLILFACLKSWRKSPLGHIKAVLVAALFFAAMHLVNVLGGNPLPVVLLQMAGAFCLGILLGGLVVSGRSIYPAVFLHGGLNLAPFLNLAANGSDGSDPRAWLYQTLLLIPLALLGIHLLRAIERSRAIKFA